MLGNWIISLFIHETNGTILSNRQKFTFPSTKRIFSFKKINFVIQISKKICVDDENECQIYVLKKNTYFVSFLFTYILLLIQIETLMPLTPYVPTRPFFATS